jgi:hypothetical protein
MEENLRGIKLGFYSDTVILSNVFFNLHYDK